MKEVGIIGITQVINNIFSFLLLPIITKTLGTYEYGLWAQISISISLLTPFALMGQSMSVVRFLSSERKKENITEGFYTILFSIIISGIIFSFFLYFSSEVLAYNVFKDPNAIYYIKTASFIVLLSAIDQIVLFYFRIFHQFKAFALLTILQSTGKVILVYLLLSFGLGLMGVIISVLLIQSLAFFMAISQIIFQIGFKIPRFINIREYLRYGLPTTPVTLLRWITHSSDRYLIGHYLNLNYVGIYSAGYTIGDLIAFFVLPIQFVLFPELSRLYDENNIRGVKLYLQYSLKYFLLISIPAVVGLTALSKPLLEILTTPDFISAYIIIPFVAAAGLLAGVYQIIVNILNVVKKTYLNLYIDIFAASSNFALNILLIPKIGILGAAITTLLAYLILVIICMYLSFKYITFYIDFSFILKSLFSSGIMYLILLFIHPSSIIDLFISVIVGGAIYFTLILLLKGFNEKEILLFRDVLSNLIKILPFRDSR